MKNNSPLLSVLAFEISALPTVLLVFVVLALTGIISTKLKLSPILFQIGFGMILGPNGINIIDFTSELNFLKELGLIILLFLAGLDFNFDNLIEKMKNAVVIATPPAIVGFGLAFALIPFDWFNFVELLLLALILTTTSISLSVSVLKNKLGKSDQIHDTVVLAIIISNVVMILVAGLITNSIKSGDLNFLSVFSNFVIVIVFIVVIMYLSRNVHLYWLEKIIQAEGDEGTEDKIRNQKMRVALGMLGVILLIAYFLNIEFAIAAFFAGVYVSQTTRLQREHMVKLNAIGYGLLIPIFFFAMGMQVNISHFFNLDVIFQVSLILIISFIAQVSLTAISSYLADFPVKESIFIGIGLSACSLSGGFAVLTIGNESGEVASTTYSIFAAVISLSVLMTIIGLELYDKFDILPKEIEQLSRSDQQGQFT